MQLRAATPTHLQTSQNRQCCQYPTQLPAGLPRDSTGKALWLQPCRGVQLSTHCSPHQAVPQDTHTTCRDKWD